MANLSLLENPVPRATHCWRCGQAFRKGVERASAGEILLTGVDDLCGWCDIEYCRESEVLGDPMPNEVEQVERMRARRAAHALGWRFECRRVAKGKHRFAVHVFNPQDEPVAILGAAHGMGDYQATCEAWKWILVFAEATAPKAAYLSA